MATIKSIEFVNKSVGYLGVDDGRIFVTTNGGRTFQEIQQVTTENMAQVASVDPNVVYAGVALSAPVPITPCDHPTLPTNYIYDEVTVGGLVPSDSSSNVAGAYTDGGLIIITLTNNDIFSAKIDLGIRPSNACGLAARVRYATINHTSDTDTVYDDDFVVTSNQEVVAHDGPNGFIDAPYDAQFDVVSTIGSPWPEDRYTFYISSGTPTKRAVELAFCWILNTTPSSPTYYVDWLNGDDGAGDGSTGNPYQTITHALSVVPSGSIISLRGSSAENTIYYEFNMTVSQNNLTITSDTGHTPIITSSAKYTTWSKTSGRTNVYQTAYTNTAVVGAWNGATTLTKTTSLGSCDSTTNSYYFVSGTLYVNIGGGVPSQINATRNTQEVFTIDGDTVLLDGDVTVQWASSGLILNGANEVDNWTFRYLVGANSNDSAIEVNDVATVSNVVIDGKKMVGILVKATANDFYGYNLDITKDITLATGECLSFLGGTGHVVEDSVFTGGNEAGLRVRSSTVTATGCIAKDFGRMGFYADNGSTCTFSRCLAYLTYDTDTIECYGFVADEDTVSANMTCDHCVAANLETNNRPPVYPASGFGVNTGGNVSITNSIAYRCYRGMGQLGAFPSLSFVESYNCLYDNSIGNYFGITGDVTDILVDPLFVDAPNSDFHLQLASPCIDAGTPAGSDIGAYETA